MVRFALISEAGLLASYESLDDAVRGLEALGPERSRDVDVVMYDESGFVSGGPLEAPRPSSA